MNWFYFLIVDISKSVQVGTKDIRHLIDQLGSTEYLIILYTQGMRFNIDRYPLLCLQHIMFDTTLYLVAEMKKICFCSDPCT